MDRRLMNYNLSFNSQDQYVIFYTNFWSHPSYSQITAEELISLDTEAMTSHLLKLFIEIKDLVFTNGVFNFIGYADPCDLTQLISARDSEIVTLQFAKLFESPNIQQYPHMLSVDIYIDVKTGSALSSAMIAEDLGTGSATLPLL